MKWMQSNTLPSCIKLTILELVCIKLICTNLYVRTLYRISTPMLFLIKGLRCVKLNFPCTFFLLLLISKLVHSVSIKYKMKTLMSFSQSSFSYRYFKILKLFLTRKRQAVISSTSDNTASTLYVTFRWTSSSFSMKCHPVVENNAALSTENIQGRPQKILCLLNVFQNAYEVADVLPAV